jgi:hypothetical protein
MNHTRVTLFTSLMASLASAAAQAGCYAVYDNQNVLVFRGSSSPVDLSRRIEPQVNAMWPGAHLIIGAASPRCTPVDSRVVAQSSANPSATKVAMMDAATQKTMAEKKADSKADAKPVQPKADPKRAMNAAANAPLAHGPNPAAKS